MPVPRILVFEDEPDMRGVLVDLLGMLGFEAVPCERYDEAIRRLRDEAFSFVLTNAAARTPQELVVRARELADTAAPVKVGLVTGWSVPAIDHPGIAFQLLKPADLTVLIGYVTAEASVADVAPGRRAAIERYFAALSSADWDGLARLCTEDVIYHLPGEHPRFSRRVEGRSAFRDFSEETFRAFPEARFHLSDAFALPDGRSVVARYTGSFRAPSGTIATEGAVIFGFRGDAIAEIGIRLDPERLDSHVG